MSYKTQYRIAKASGNLEKFRGQMISKAISAQVPISAQLAKVMNAVEYLFQQMEKLHGQDFRPEEWTEYENMRNTIKQAIDSIHEQLDN